MSYLRIEDLPVVPTDDLKDKIKSVRVRHHLPGNKDLLIKFQNGIMLSLIKGPWTYGLFEMAILKDGDFVETEDGGIIYRTDSKLEVIQIMRKAASI